MEMTRPRRPTTYQRLCDEARGRRYRPALTADLHGDGTVTYTLTVAGHQCGGPELDRLAERLLLLLGWGGCRR